MITNEKNLIVGSLNRLVLAAIMITAMMGCSNVKQTNIQNLADFQVKIRYVDINNNEKALANSTIWFSYFDLKHEWVGTTKKTDENGYVVFDVPADTRYPAWSLPFIFSHTEQILALKVIHTMRGDITAKRIANNKRKYVELRILNNENLRNSGVLVDGSLESGKISKNHRGQYYFESMTVETTK